MVPAILRTLILQLLSSACRPEEASHHSFALQEDLSVCKGDRTVNGKPKMGVLQERIWPGRLALKSDSGLGIDPLDCLLYSDKIEGSEADLGQAEAY